MALVLLLLMVWSIQTYRYARVWTDRLTLAQYVAEQAPAKPRALMNYGVMLASRGQLAEGQELFFHALSASQLPYIRTWDARLMGLDLAKNMEALDQLQAQLNRAVHP